MNLRKYTNLDYWTLTSWWHLHDWPCPDQEMLPETGFIVEDICAGFLYKTDSKIALLEFIISNPQTTKEKRANGLDILITALCEEAKKLEFKAIFTSVQHKKLIQRYENHGFVIADNDMKNMVKRI